MPKTTITVETEGRRTVFTSEAPVSIQQNRDVITERTPGSKKTKLKPGKRITLTISTENADLVEGGLPFMQAIGQEGGDSHER